jgi:hypothetical protein
MDQTLVNNYENLLHAAKGVLSVENNNWPFYVKSEFAQLRIMVERVEERKDLLNRSIESLLKGNYIATDIEER